MFGQHIKSKSHSSHGMQYFGVHRYTIFQLNFFPLSKWVVVIFEFGGNINRLFSFIFRFFANKSASVCGMHATKICVICVTLPSFFLFSSSSSFVNYTHVDRIENIFNTNKNSNINDVHENYIKKIIEHVLLEMKADQMWIKCTDHLFACRVVCSLVLNARCRTSANIH